MCNKIILSQRFTFFDSICGFDASLTGLGWLNCDAGICDDLFIWILGPVPMGFY